jgi:hypothetical protein
LYVGSGSHSYICDITPCSPVKFGSEYGHVPPKHGLFFGGLHSVISQKMEVFVLPVAYIRALSVCLAVSNDWMGVSNQLYV